MKSIHNLWARTLVVLACLSLASLACTRTTHATAVSPSDMFLAPSLVQDDLYEEHDLATTGEQIYTDSSVGGTLLGVKILPLLVPNPFSSQGQYTDSDLAGITQSNYSQYFADLPDQQYAADFTGQQITIDYGAPGSYLVEITAESSGVDFTKIYNDQVDDAIGQNPAAGVPKDKVGVSRLVQPNSAPMADLIVVSNQAKEGAAANGYTAAALATLQSQGKNVVTADSLDDAINKIMAESVKQGKPITVDLVGHGTPGTILIGSDTLAAKGGKMTPAQLGAALKGKVSNLNFYSCNTGQGQAGKNMAKDITTAAMINSIGAFNTFTSAYPPTPQYAPVYGFNGFRRTVTWVATGQTNPGYFDVGGRGIRGALVPEPASLVLMAMAGAAMVWVRRRGGTAAG
jgi:hypothetical protein